MHQCLHQITILVFNCHYHQIKALHNMSWLSITGYQSDTDAAPVQSWCVFFNSLFSIVGNSYLNLVFFSQVSNISLDFTSERSNLSWLLTSRYWTLRKEDVKRSCGLGATALVQWPGNISQTESVTAMRKMLNVNSDRTTLIGRRMLSLYCHAIRRGE